MKREGSRAVRTFLGMNVEGSRRREWPKKMRLDSIKSDMAIAGVSVGDVRDGSWRVEV